MFRLEGLSRLIWESVPAGAAAPFGVITALGSATFLLLALSLLYWLDERRSTAAVVSYALIALAVVVGLKAALALPRPPEAVRLIALHADPYGFPSGHAVAAVVVYGGLVTVRDRLDDRRAVTGVAVVVALVGLSRVVLGMHYVGDVVVGTALGLALLAVCVRLVGDDPTRGFALAALLSVPALAVTGLGAEALLAFGGSLGGVLGGLRLDGLAELQSRFHGVVLTAVGVPFVFLTDALADGLVEPVLVVLAYTLLVAGILRLPALVHRLPLDAVRRASKPR
ncbi:PAP2 superfamily protein [Halomicrobium zhouii]|uniref:PAP2 superfamily protein n=1 Tax=Halomicrobium zhouii TaxID=767519 RepID=A0A1I6LY42_9EURY|nr:phosphatase PAP2 family protein [Halomicrobium zhouii]SFS08391.1 PAP2 superfamily protein [Halomicrobium zhouii]